MTDAETLLILDVDTGIDDALGLLLACAAPAATILGVSTVAGNVDLQRATRNTRAVLALAGRSDIPVWPGCVRPLVREAADASLIHGGSGLGHAVLPEPDAPEAADNAIDAVVAAARKYPGQVVLVATGPLTNIAVALMREPELPKYLKRLVLMGGAYREGGNATPAAEFNIWHDPDAARIVFRSFGGEGSSPLVAVGLDVTRQTLLLPEHLDQLAGRCADAPRGPALLRFLEDSTRHYFEFIEKRIGRRHVVMHDPLAVAAALDPTLIDTTAVAVDVETAGTIANGMTLADWRDVWRRRPNAEVAVGVGADRVIAAFLDAIERLARQPSTGDQPRAVPGA
jgi:purine nucleosidase